jgi:hypothetical protein
VKNHRANFVAFPQKTQNLVLAYLIIVFRGIWPKFNFFQLRAAAALALFVRFFIRLIKIFAVIGNFANRRIGRRRDFHQIQALFLGHANRFKRLHYSKLAAFFIDNSDLARPDSLINTNAVGLSEIALCDDSPLLNQIADVGCRHDLVTPTRHTHCGAGPNSPHPVHRAEIHLGRASKYSTLRGPPSKWQKGSASIPLGTIPYRAALL